MKRLIRLGIVALVFSALGAVVLIVPATRWRGVVVARKVTGTLQDVGWKDLYELVRPDAVFQLHRLAVSGNPYSSLDDPDTSPADRARGKELFALRCAKCHGTAAAGGLAPQLSGSMLRHGDSDWAIYRTVTRGIPGTAMQGGLLERPDVWRVIAYLHELHAHASTDAARAAALGDLVADETTAAQLLDSTTPQASWRLPGGSYNGQRFSRDPQINTTNVARLAVRWVHQFPSTPTPNESTPVVIGNYMYLTLPPSTVVALDVRSGAQIWQYQHPMPADLRLCCLSSNRGVSVFGRRVYLATLDAHLLALDARSGALLWDTQVADYSAGFSMTSAPLPVGDQVILGTAGGDFPVRGFIAAYDAATGAQRWVFHTVPEPGEPGNETWGGESWRTGGAAAWGLGAYDPELGLLYWGVGNAAPDYNRRLRPGDNLYSNSVVALEANTGKLAWYFQFNPADDHDWDSVQTPALIDVKERGDTSKLLAVANRNGFFYVLDRRNGHFIRGAPYAKQTWATGLSGAGRPLRVANSDPTPEGVYLYPSVSGATNWWPSAYSPTAQLYYANVLEQGGLFFDSSSPPRVERGRMYTGGAARIAEGEPAAAYVRAIDPLTSQVRWERRNLTETDAPRGGLLATAGGLLFGSDGPRLYALDAATGRELWSFATGGQISAPPMSYRAGDSQVIAVLAGQDLFTFSLPAAGDRPHAGTAVVLAGRPANPHQPLIRPITFQ
jgi:alcohol dehydrogenase (cytochrome c)